MKSKKPSEKSKQIFNLAFGGLTVITLYAMIAMILIRDLSPLIYLIPAWAGLAATSAGFYYWKAKAENVVKLPEIMKNNSMDIKNAVIDVIKNMQ